jgi:hypothetical protein
MGLLLTEEEVVVVGKMVENILQGDMNVNDYVHYYVVMLEN